MDSRKTINRLISLVLVSIVCLVIVQLLTPIEPDRGFLISRFIVTCIFIWCGYKGIHEDYYINPYLLFAITPLSLMVYSEKVSSYYLRALNGRTWFIAILNMIAFLAALELANNKPVKIDGTESLSFMSIQRPDDSLLIHAILLFIVGKMPDLILMATGSSIPFGHFFSMCQFIGIALAYKIGHKKLSFCFIGIYLVILLLTTFNKTNFFMVSITLLVCLEGDAVTKKQRGKVVILTVVGAIFIILIAFPLKDYLAGGGDLSQFFESNLNSLSDYYSDRISWNGPQQLMIPYMYLTTSWNNLQYVMESISSHTYGLWLIKPFLGYIQLSGYIDAYTALEPFRNAFNTYGFIAVQYVDFGLVGSAFSSVLIGIFVGKTYRRYRYCPDGFNIACYSLVACATLEMFFSNHFWGQSYPFTILIVSWLYEKIGLRLVWGKNRLSMNSEQTMDS